VKRIVLALAVAAVFPTAGALAAPSGASCFVSPNPAPLHGDVTVRGSGLEPNQDYRLYVDQPGNQIPGGGHSSWGDITDASGNFVATFNLDTVYGGPLEVGTVQLRIRPALK
jgi:hypothetical protein